MVSYGLYLMMPGLNQWSSCAGENKNNHPLEPERVAHTCNHNTQESKTGG